MTMHPDEIDIPDAAASALIAAQFPQWARLPVRRVRPGGTVSAIFRIGEQFAARFPLQGSDAATARETLEREAAAAAEFAGCSPFPAPVPAGIGEPGPGYPLPWAVQTWIPGTIAIAADPGGSEDFARDLARLITALRAAPTRGRVFAGPGRGGQLADHDEWVGQCLRRSEQLLDTAALARQWERFRALPRTAADVMTHGDLIPANVLVDGGRLGGVLDAGGFAPADPALDVIVAWHLLDGAARAVFRAELGCDDLEWERARAWAFEQALGLVWYYVASNPPLSQFGRRTLSRIAAAA